jgi:hypothetical protein
VHRPRCSALARELGRERGGGASEGVEDQERQDGGQVQATERRDDAPEDVQVRVAYRAARHKQHFHSEITQGIRASYMVRQAKAFPSSTAICFVRLKHFLHRQRRD